ncbi:hypothetical protein WG66_002343 [Moniliophthora roreri]|nr:hypothetical protein WG66_002343 [Moniliophthora roreri]
MTRSSFCFDAAGKPQPKFAADSFETISAQFSTLNLIRFLTSRSGRNSRRNSQTDSEQSKEDNLELKTLTSEMHLEFEHGRITGRSQRATGNKCEGFCCRDHAPSLLNLSRPTSKTNIAPALDIGNERSPSPDQTQHGADREDKLDKDSLKEETGQALTLGTKTLEVKHSFHTARY